MSPDGQVNKFELLYIVSVKSKPKVFAITLNVFLNFHRIWHMTLAINA